MLFGMLAKKSILCWLLAALLPLLPLHALQAGAQRAAPPETAMQDMHGQHGDHGGAHHEAAQQDDGTAQHTCHDDGCSATGHCCAVCLHEFPSLTGLPAGFLRITPQAPSYGADLSHEIEPPRALHA